MTLQALNYLVCDSRVAGECCYVESTTMPTQRSARLEAQDEGWVKRRVDGKTIDVCPACLLELEDRNTA